MATSRPGRPFRIQRGCPSSELRSGPKGPSRTIVRTYHGAACASRLVQVDRAVEDSGADLHLTTMMFFAALYHVLHRACAAQSQASVARAPRLGGGIVTLSAVTRERMRRFMGIMRDMPSAARQKPALLMVGRALHQNWSVFEVEARGRCAAAGCTPNLHVESCRRHFALQRRQHGPMANSPRSCPSSTVLAPRHLSTWR